MRVAVFGDVAGHLTELEIELVKLGVDTVNGVIPEDLTVVQVGDLVHRGPNSAGVIALVERFRVNSPDRWKQILGNHEAIYVLGEVFKWEERIDEQSVATLQSWWESGWMKLAYSFDSAGYEIKWADGKAVVGMGTTLVTHAGLTVGLLLELEAPGPEGVAAAINKKGREKGIEVYDSVFRPGRMLGAPQSLSAGVIWAEAASEVYESWARADESGLGLKPLHQIHGHSVPFYWGGGTWSQPLPYRLAGNGDVKVRGRALRAVRHTVVEVAGSTFFGIDPGNNSRAMPGWAPLVLESKE